MDCSVCRTCINKKIEVLATQPNWDKQEATVTNTTSDPAS